MRLLVFSSKRTQGFDPIQYSFGGAGTWQGGHNPLNNTELSKYLVSFMRFASLDYGEFSDFFS